MFNCDGGRTATSRNAVLSVGPVPCCFRNPGEYKLSQITLLIVDTRNIPHGTFVKDLDLLKVFSEYSDPNLELNLAYLETMRLGSRGYYFGEYLSQDRLHLGYYAGFDK